MEDSDNFTPNLQGCNSILCKHKVTRDGDDAVSYTKALQKLQSTLRSEKYNGNGTMAQNDPLYKNLARCVGFFDNDKQSFPTKNDCKSKPTRTFTSSPSQSQSNPSGVRFPVTESELKSLLSSVTKLNKYLSNKAAVRFRPLIRMITTNINDLKKIELSQRSKDYLKDVERYIRIIEARYEVILNANKHFDTTLEKLNDEITEYLEWVKIHYGMNRKFGKKGTKKNTDDSAEKQRAKEEKQQAAEEAKRAKEEIKRAKEEIKRAKEEKKQAAEQAKHVKENAKRAKEDEIMRAKEQAKRRESEIKQAEEEARRAESQAKRVEEQAKRAEEEARRAESREKRLREEQMKSKKVKTTNGKTKRNNSSPRRESSPTLSPRTNSKKKRCQNGTRRNKKTGNCEPYNK